MNSFEIEKETCKRCQKHPVIVLSQIAVICKAEKIAGQKSTEIKCRKYYAITYNEQIIMSHKNLPFVLYELSQNRTVEVYELP